MCSACNSYIKQTHLCPIVYANHVKASLPISHSFNIHSITFPLLLIIRVHKLLSKPNRNRLNSLMHEMVKPKNQQRRKTPDCFCIFAVFCRTHETITFPNIASALFTGNMLGNFFSVTFSPQNFVSMIELMCSDPTLVSRPRSVPSKCWPRSSRVQPRKLSPTSAKQAHAH